MKLDDWLLERIKSIYPLFKIDESEIFRLPPHITAVIRLVNDIEKTIKLEFTLNGDEKHPIGYNVAFEDNTLYIQRKLT